MRVPKTAESTVIYHLKRNGIQRRDRAEHVRKVTAEMVDEWVRRYQDGESLKQIAGDEVDPVTVWNHLRSRGVVLRDRVEAQIKAVMKYERCPFSGDRLERAYLMGLRYGDLHVVKHGRAIRVRVSTTHPAMADLFEGSFSPYGKVHRYPRKAKLTGFEWTLECDLDESFFFLLRKADLSDLESLPLDELTAFLSGLFDAEGSVYLHNKRGRYNPELFFSNTDAMLVDFVSRSMARLGFQTKVGWRHQDEDRNGVFGSSRIARVGLWRFEEVKKMLRVLGLRRPEKLEKAKIILRMKYGVNDDEYRKLVDIWHELISKIREERDTFVDSARTALAHGGEDYGPIANQS